MSGYSETIERRICRAFGAGLLFTWLVNENTILNPKAKKPTTLKFKDDEHPIAVQLFGVKPEKIGIAAQICKEMGFDSVDINACCPANNVIRKGAGGALLKDLDLIRKIIASIKEKTNLPISIKFRAGFSQNKPVFLELAKIANEFEIDLLIFHPAPVIHCSQKSNWNLIKELKESTTIQVIGNGDIKSSIDALRMKTETNCDGIMIGRASIGCPWIFTETIYRLKGTEPPTIKEMIELAYKRLTGNGSLDANSDIHAIIKFALFHLDLLEQEYQSEAHLFAIKEIPLYIKGFPGAKEIRLQLFNTNGDIKKMREILMMCEEKAGRLKWDLQ